ncbi:uncharacterized protein SPSK_06964 [Sporothrix schenckii 1099-18]|uniref:YMC020W-like alpha/beta hydrolase domain-containing protein n=1 Tax=Sporothrix schenckii 1099-18 TaxID=1397361 RepID=A0A0F2MH24_SPOSC|nr:uncharacterized protein SPSK_06964 [Sporothrix schenckii 1099-18]KJR88379.1 hypothetical protein SPSK_06964 [Sporothrix schenckii 1099-18]
MSPRKRPRAAPSDGNPPPPTDSTSSSSSSSSLPTPSPAQANSASQASDASADSVMARSPTDAMAPSVAESTSNASRYASVKESDNKNRSRYGSWPRKSKASTQVARETILGGTLKPSATSNLSRFDTRKAGDDGPNDNPNSSGPALSRKPSTTTLTGASGVAKRNGAASIQGSGRAEAAMTHATAKGTIGNGASKLAPDTSAKAPDSTEPVAAADVMDTTQDDGAPTVNNTSQTSAQPAGWFSWGRKEAAQTKPPVVEDSSRQTPELPKSEDSQAPSTPHAEAPQDAPAPQSVERPTTSGSMWTYLWRNGAHATTPSTTKAQEAGRVGENDQNSTTAETTDTTQPQDIVMEDAPSAPIPVPTASSASSTVGANNASGPATATGSVGSTWAFWSRDARKTTGKSPESTGSNDQGEIAIIGERSEANPKPAVSGLKVNNDKTPSKASSMKDVPVKGAATKDGLSKEASVKEAARNAASIAAAAAVAAASSKKNKRLRPKSMEIDEASIPGSPAQEVQIHTPSKSNESLPLPSKHHQIASSAASTSGSMAKGQLTPAKPPPPNLLFPSFRSTYRLKENPSILKQLAQLLLRTQQAPANHVFLSKDLPKVKKAVAIGVHGLFPAAYLRPMIGQPTGTSIRFVNHAAEAVRRWADRNGCEDCEIEKIALEGEGKIADRVDNLWKLLLNWIDHIRNADLVVLACHSQGVPVSFILLEKLIDMGIVTKARIGVCAMAGVSLGPFPDYKAGLGILMGSASELWDFANPESDVSKRYEHSLKTALNYGVRVTFVGSIDDQVVPLESAIHSPVHHPIAHLVGFACKLRNLGVSDHGLIRELSVPLAGSLYSGEGHSRLYDDSQVYDLAVSHCLETASVNKPVCEIAKHGSLTNPNPYHLPWIMRGLLEEDFVKTELHDETAELVKQFDDWKPVTKALKDVKYRLEAVRSRL